MAQGCCTQLTVYPQNRDYIVITNKGNTAKGIKPDVYPHYFTGIFPSLMYMQDLVIMLAGRDVLPVATLETTSDVEFPYKTLPMNQLAKDELLCTFIVAWWTEILSHIPLPGRASVLANTPKAQKQKNENPPHYHHNPPWERRILQCTTQTDSTLRV